MREENSILQEVMTSKQTERLQEFEPSRLAFELLDGLDSRSRDIVLKRFNLDGKGERTLEFIGKSYQITRERVRQIETSVIKKMQEKAELIRDAEALVLQTLAQYGQVAEEQFLLSAILGRNKDVAEDRSALALIIRLSKEIVALPETADRKSGWMNKKADEKLFERLMNRAEKILLTMNKPLELQELATNLIDAERASSDISAESINQDMVLSALMLSKRIHENPFHQWGLLVWREIMPKGVRDKAYIVLKKQGDSLHFVELTKLINQAAFDHKTAYPQTVHNELIKDERFVLVGRGMYALREWGYEPGTVAQVIHQILANAGAPLSREQIVEQVLSRRVVKKNTILLALQNKAKFKRVEKDLFTVA